MPDESTHQAASYGTFAYKPGFREVIERLKLLQSRRGVDRIFAMFEVPSAALERFAARYSGEFCEYPDPEERARFWEEYLAERVGLEDDSVPIAYLSEFDQGLYGGLVGGDVRFLPHPENGWISSMVPPVLRDWSDFERLEFREDHPWLARYRRQLQVFREHAAGKFGISHFILIDGLNFVFELVGATRTYLSLDENPAMVRRAMELAARINRRVLEIFFEEIPLVEGGTCSNMVQWAPGRIVSESVDPYHMTTPKYFEEWGRETVQGVFDAFDGGVLHLHGNGRHLLESVITLRGLRAIYLGDDRGYAPACDVLAQMRRRAGDLPLVTAIPLEVFTARLKEGSLPGGVLYKVRGAAEAAEVNRLMERVRAYRTA